MNNINCIVLYTGLFGVHKPSLINVKENRRDNQKWTIQRNWQHWVYKTQHENKQNKKHNTLCVEHHFTVYTK
jgi:hypothetical protein